MRAQRGHDGVVAPLRRGRERARGPGGGGGGGGGGRGPALPLARLLRGREEVAGEKPPLRPRKVFLDVLRREGERRPRIVDARILGDEVCRGGGGRGGGGGGGEPCCLRRQRPRQAAGVAAAKVEDAQRPAPGPSKFRQLRGDGRGELGVAQEARVDDELVGLVAVERERGFEGGRGGARRRFVRR